MTKTDAPTAPPLLARRAAGVLLAVLASAAVVGVWWFFVTTPSGQRVDEIAYLGSRIGRSRLDGGAQTVLDVVSVPFLALVVVVAGAVALLRRRLMLAVAVAAVVGGANVTTQLLKYHVFTRPELGISEAGMNSLPSGHTTVAATVAGAALLATPPRWRWLALLVGLAYAGGTGGRDHGRRLAPRLRRRRRPPRRRRVGLPGPWPSPGRTTAAAPPRRGAAGPTRSPGPSSPSPG
ncbi:hypothetical protein [Georgenia sp. SUBG003]|uniref:hypothetical protein n=1 Tax=Georgenia sp. SUBG003 TaxID=1497974 RepID=UPI000694D456